MPCFVILRTYTRCPTTTPPPPLPSSDITFKRFRGVILALAPVFEVIGNLSTYG